METKIAENETQNQNAFSYEGSVLMKRLCWNQMMKKL
jgi:hypothetical protein